MPDFLLHFDQQLFHFFNSDLANPVFDVVMPFITNVKHLYPVYALLFILLLWRGGANGKWASLLLVATVAIADPLSSRVLKEAVGRERPCRAMEDVRLLVNCGGGKSFPSSHAVNNFAALVIFFWFFRRFAWIWLLIASAVSFSRIYVGVHYPLDILGGAVVGIIVGIAVVALFELLRKEWRKKREREEYKRL
ncbi:MAG: phosphatase PAP2 family protein [Candidatus Kapaibacterium sp.]